MHISHSCIQYTSKKFTEEIFNSVQPEDGLSELEVKDLKDAYLGARIPEQQLDHEQLKKWGYIGDFAWERYWLVNHSLSY